MIAITLSSCDVMFSSNNDSGLELTQSAVNLRQTQVAEQNAQQRSLNATLDAQQAILDSQDTSNSNNPQESPSVDADQQITQTIITTPIAATPAPTASPEPTATIQASPTPDLDSLMQSANILLYEDMVGNLDTIRFIKNTLDDMGLSYKDDGSAKGWLKTDLLGGAPDGKPWDLVIIAAEAKSGFQGEFFEFVNQALDQGTSVIMEVWYLDKTHAGTASTLLSRCGIKYESNWTKVPPERMVMFPLDSSHPIMQEPNSLSFTDVTSYWAYGPDVGDKVQITGNGDAKLLVGTIGTEKNTHGTVTVCIDEQLILQTFSSHMLTYDAMNPVWENYINHALKVRFLGSP